MKPITKKELLTGYYKAYGLRETLKVLSFYIIGKYIFK